MKKKVVLIALVVTALLFSAGIFITATAHTRGINVANITVRNNGGSMDTSQFHMLIDNATTSFHVAGFVISLVGGLGLLISGYALYKELY